MNQQESIFKDAFTYFLCGAQENHLAMLIRGRAIDMGKDHQTQIKQDGTEERQTVCGSSDNVIPEFKSMSSERVTKLSGKIVTMLRFEYQTAEDAIRALPYFPGSEVQIGVCFNSDTSDIPRKGVQFKEFNRQEVLDTKHTFINGEYCHDPLWTGAKKLFQSAAEFDLETNERVWNDMMKHGRYKAVWDEKHNLVHPYVEGQTIIMNDRIKNYWMNRARALFAAAEQKLDAQLTGLGNPRVSDCLDCAAFTNKIKQWTNEIDKVISH